MQDTAPNQDFHADVMPLPVKHPRATNQSLMVSRLPAALLLLQAGSTSPHAAVIYHRSDLVAVHVLEKCLLFVPWFETGDYASQLQGDTKRRLVLSFRAFKFSRAPFEDRKCWKIEDIVAGESQALHPLGADSDPEPLEISQVFCVEDEQPLSSGEDLNKFLYYGENEAGSAAMVEVGADPDVMQKRG